MPKPDDNRLLSAEPGLRRIAPDLFEQARALPIVIPHGQTDPRPAEDIPPTAASLTVPALVHVRAAVANIDGGWLAR